MATMLVKSMNVVARVQALSTSSQLERTSASILGGLRLNIATLHSPVALRSAPARSIAVVRAGEGVTDKGRRLNWNRGQLAYVIVYVSDVNRAAEFYNKAFGLEIRPQNKSSSWVEMETGATTLAFTPVKQHETELTGGVSSSGNDNVVINLDFEDVEAAFKALFIWTLIWPISCLIAGSILWECSTPYSKEQRLAEPEDKSWPQKVGYVKDIDGNIVRLGSFPGM